MVTEVLPGSGSASMKYFKLIRSDIDVAPLLEEVKLAGAGVADRYRPPG